MYYDTPSSDVFYQHQRKAMCQCHLLLYSQYIESGQEGKVMWIAGPVPWGVGSCSFVQKKKWYSPVQFAEIDVSLLREMPREDYSLPEIIYCEYYE